MDVDIDQDDPEVALEGRGQYYQYPKDKIQEAIEKIQNNEMSYGEASRHYGVPKTTLYNKMQNNHNGRRGATTTLTKAQEDELAEWILKHQEYGDPRTKQDIMNTACEIAELDQDSSNHFKNGLPTAGWVDGFLKRYPHIVYRKPESISKAAAVNTKEDFSKLWRNIYGFMEKTDQLHLLHKPEHWWNADETSFPKDPIPRKVLARKGSKNVHRRERRPPKSNTTFTYAFSAAGDYIEPLITLKDSASNIADIAFSCGSVGANFAINQTDSGWAKEDSFYHFVATHLHTQWELKGSPRPRILIMDGYRAHLSVRLLRWGRLNDCIIIVLYPNGTPYLQMCDTTMFKPMKEKHIVLYQQWRLKNPIGNSDDVVLVKLVKMVNDAVIRKESIINGWRATGLQIFNFNNLKCDDLLSKSPHYLYDFKGHHIASSTTETTETDADSTLEMDLCQNNDYETFQTIHFGDGATLHQSNSQSNSQSIHLSTDNNSFGNGATLHQSNGQSMVHLSTDNNSFGNGATLQQSNGQSMVHLITDNSSFENLVQGNTIFSKYGGGCSTTHEVPVMHINDLQQSDIAFKDIVCIGQNEVADPVERNIPTPNCAQESSASNSFAVKFSELSGRNEIFRSNVDTGFDLIDFGISNHSESTQAETKLLKLTQKIRRDVKELGLLCAATNKKKLVNVLIINQQLDAIDPPAISSQEPAGSSNETRTIKSILVPPTMPQRMKPKTHKNIKVGYGVATAEEVLEHIAEQEILDGQLEVEQEENEIEKKARETKIEDVEKQLQETRKVLTILRTENAVNVKEAAQQKKSKKRGSAGNATLLDETIVQNKAKMEAKDEELKALRDQLKTLKAHHILANKAAASKRRNDIQLKRERGNVVMPPPASQN